MFVRRSADDERVVSEAMRDLASEPLPRTLPDPSFIWWKAQLLRRLEAEREAVAPLEVGDRVHIGAAVLGACALAAGAWEYLPGISFSIETGATIAAGVAVLLTIAAIATLSAVRER